MSSYRNNYNNSSEYGGYGSSSNYSNSPSYIPSSRRPDGSYREEIRVRPGHVPEAERQSYAPPQSRASSGSNYSGYSSSGNAAAGADDRVDSWADMDAPVLSEYSESESNVVEEPEPKAAENEIKTEAPVTSKPAAEAVTPDVASVTEAEEAESSSSPAPTREPRKPSQLATAIDTAIDSSLSSVSGTAETGAARPIGRFAAQIANDERDGRSSYAPRRYDSNGYSRPDYQGYRDTSRSSYTTGTGSTWNRGTSYNNNMNRDPADDSPSVSAANLPNNLGSSVGNSSGEIRVEKEFKSFLDQLNSLRREMAVINAKLEYIRFFKSLDTAEMNEVERARVSKEKDLVGRMDAIFEAIDALSLNHQ